MKFRLFISSVQSEFAEERRLLKVFVERNPLLNRFFTVFSFEHDVAPQDRRADEVYLMELAKCDFYIGLIGQQYGSTATDGISPTECEFNEASRLGMRRFVFVKEMPEGERAPEELAFLKRLSSTLVWGRFANWKELEYALTTTLAKVLEEMKTSFSGESFEAEECGRWEDLNENRLRWFVRQARALRGFPVPEDAPTVDILTALGMVGPNGNPRRAAMMCFGKNPLEYAVSGGVKCVEWYGTQRAKPMGDYKWYEGDVFHVADEALEFIKRKMRLRVEGIAGGDGSTDSFEINAKVVREAINNAIAHRDYTSNASVQVEMFRDRIEITNPGPLNKAMTYEMLFQKHQSYPNNPLIAKAMYYTKHIEDVGSGTIDMLNTCKAEGLKEPKFEPDAQQVVLTLYRPTFNSSGEKVGAQIPESRPVNGKSRPVNGKRHPVNGENRPVNIGQELCNEDVAAYLLTKGVRKDLRGNMVSVFMHIAGQPNLSYDALCMLTHLPRTVVRTSIAALKDYRLLKRIGSDKTGHWQTFFPPNEV